MNGRRKRRTLGTYQTATAGVALNQNAGVSAAIDTRWTARAYRNAKVVTRLLVSAYRMITRAIPSRGNPDEETALPKEPSLPPDLI
jgi:hypothetical protein